MTDPKRHVHLKMAGMARKRHLHFDNTWIDEEIDMASTWDGSTCSTPGFNLSIDIKKYVVIKNNGSYLSSFDEEKAAIDWCRKAVKLEPDNRYYILESKKEVGAKSPEIEIEDL